jgi:cytochrome c peroxidase
MTRFLGVGGSLALALAILGGVVALRLDSTEAPQASRPPQAHADTPFEPIPAPPAQRSIEVALGARLFDDTQLSADGTVACATCHDLAHGGADGRATAVGIGGTVGTLNTPTVFNAALNPKQFWDGRAHSLEDQIDGPVQNPREMGSRWSDVVAKLDHDTAYVASFRAVYEGGITPARIKSAIAAYERTLVTRGSRFDRYLSGDAAALTAQETEGLRLFQSYGCVTCHQGRNVGGNLFEKLGIVSDYFAERGTALTTEDLGRYNVTKREDDRFVFRVPSLRLAVLTPPYLHDGAATTLEEAVILMGRYQLGEELPPADVAAIAAFLGTLAGTYPAPLLAGRP